MKAVIKKDVFIASLSTVIAAVVTIVNTNPLHSRRWELVPSPDLSWERSRVALVGPRRAVWALRSGDEIRIDYGDRGQEAMLFAYGMLSKARRGGGGRDCILELSYHLTVTSTFSFVTMVIYLWSFFKYAGFIIL